MRRALGSNVLWQRAPLSAIRQDVEDRIEDFADIHMPFAFSVPSGRDERLHETPFVFGQVARITKALGLADPVPDANTFWTYREALKKTSAIDGLFQRFDEVLRASGFLAMSGQIVDATIVAGPKQRNTIEEKKAIREGAFQMAGSRNPCGSPRRTRMHAGPSNT